MFLVRRTYMYIFAFYSILQPLKYVYSALLWLWGHLLYVWSHTSLVSILQSPSAVLSQFTSDESKFSEASILHTYPLSSPSIMWKSFESNFKFNQSLRKITHWTMVIESSNFLGSVRSLNISSAQLRHNIPSGSIFSREFPSHASYIPFETLFLSLARGSIRKNGSILTIYEGFLSCWRYLSAVSWTK